MLKFCDLNTKIKGGIVNHFPILSKESAKLCESDYLKATKLEEYNLSELAGLACAKEILDRYGPFSSDHIVVCAGPGKNGADGIATAMFLAPHAKKISICMPVPPKTDLHLRKIEAFYTNIEITDTLVSGDIYIDALFGIDLDKKPNETFQQLIIALNQQLNSIISIDVPSGIDADISASVGEFVKPNLTLATSCFKLVHFHATAKMICGEIVCIDTGLPRDFVEKYAEKQKLAC